VAFVGTTLANVTINDSGAFDLAALTLTGNLSVTSGGAISDSGVIDVDGTASFTTGSANIDIDNATGNGLTGAVSFTTTGTGDVTFDNGTTAINLGTVMVGQNLSITSGDSITDSGVITVGGTASFETDTSDKLITLNLQNAITGQVTFNTTGTGGDVYFDNGTKAISLGTISSGDIAGDLTLLTDADQTISNAITLNGSGADLSITVDNANSLTVQAALTTNAGDITLSGEDDVIFTAAGDLTSGNGNIIVKADDDSTSDAASGGALTMVDGTIFNAGSGTITGTSDEDITLGQMTTINTTSTAITLNTKNGNILDGGDTDQDLTAASGTVSVTTGGGTFGTTLNAIEINSASLSKTGEPVTVVTPTSEENLSGTTETVGQASVDQTINIAGNIANAVESANKIVVGSGASTVAVNIDSSLLGSGPVTVDVFSEQFPLLVSEGVDVGEFNSVWVSDEDEN
jgi:hypothetical protein